MVATTRARIGGFAVLFVALCLGVGVFAQERRELIGFVGQVLTGTVIAVADGDSVRIRLDSTKKVIPVRLDGVDAPERQESFSDRARSSTRVLLFDKKVELRARDVDNFNRLVARVTVEGKDSSLALIQSGLACHYTRFENDAVLAKAQISARASGRGFWAAGAPKPRCVKYTSFGSAPLSNQPGSVEPSSAPLHGNRRSRVYHSPRCENYNCPNCTVVFASRDEATAAGYRPAGDCMR